MRTGRIVISILALLTALAIPMTAQAGGWVVVTLDRVPTGVQPQVPFSVGFMVRQHGRTPNSGFPATIKARNTSTHELVMTTAKPEGKTGHFVATLTLPSAGQWEWEIDVIGPAAVMSPLQVGAAPAPAVAPGRRTAAQAAQSPAPSRQSSLWIAAFALVALAGVLTAAARMRRYRLALRP